MKAVRGAVTLYVLAAVLLWLIGKAFSVHVPITWTSVAALWAILLILAYVAYAGVRAGRSP